MKTKILSDGDVVKFYSANGGVMQIEVHENSILITSSTSALAIVPRPESAVEVGLVNSFNTGAEQNAKRKKRGFSR